MTPRVSVVIPHFERSGLLRAAIDSVLASSVGNLEIIVVDDGSSDAEWDTVQQFGTANVRILRRIDGLKGPSRCRNLGVAASTGEYIVFLDSDDLMAPWCIEHRLRAAERFANADLWVFPVLLFERIPGDTDLLWNAIDDGRDAAERFASGDSAWHTSSPLWRKTALAAIGGFNESVIYGDDSDLHLRAIVSGLSYRTQADADPDIFIRRSPAPRITNTLDAGMVESRRARLREGTRFLKSHQRAHQLLSSWEAQYFIEAEFLLFNLGDFRQPIGSVLTDWEAEFVPSAAVLKSVRGYFAIAMASRQRAYVLLRVARRVAMILLPTAFFPGRHAVPEARADTAVMERIRSAMKPADVRR